MAELSFFDIEDQPKQVKEEYNNFCLNTPYQLQFKKSKSSGDIADFISAGYVAVNAMKSLDTTFTNPKDLVVVQYSGCALRDALNRYASRYTLYKKGIDSRFESATNTAFRVGILPEAKK